MIFDTHAHYYDEAFDADRDALLASLPGRGVALVVCPGCDPESSRQSIALAERYGFLYAAAGYHPENLEGAALSDLDAVRALCAHPKVVAVGEIGLDYYWLKTPEERANSRDFFDAQLSLAEELNLPAIVHDRDAHRDCLDIVRAPYMAPEPYRGQRCDSTMIARSAETVAQLRGLTRDEVEAVTLENGKKFFGIA